MSTMGDSPFINARKQPLQEQSLGEHQEVESLIQPLLETERGFIKKLDRFLTCRDELELRKRELLHQRWTKSVWLPVQRSIQKHLTQWGDYETHKLRSLNAHYIHYINTKGFVFLDSYAPLEYNPFPDHFHTSHHQKVTSEVSVRRAADQVEL
ncbi:hypothetical protein DNTS_024003 [Danionella cerebrum]|uniref:Uncharacterized protein n=1 Tax=Danionella cerebrum TaxID=2873325 RepID=A0A553MVD5_9TELE|nr:hypothetical protein DNTS_024003 [Danionella translucida]